MNINISLSFSFYKFCEEPIDLIDRIIKSRVKSISITSIHDIVPTIIKSKKYFKKLKLLKFIKCSNKTNIIHQILEVNYVLYNRYFPFHSRHIAIGNKILDFYKEYKKVGIHIRLGDECLSKCAISIENIQRISNITSMLCKNCIIMLSSFSRNFTKLFINYNKNVFIYNSSCNIKHSSKSLNFNQLDIDKIVLDIYLTSKSDILILSSGSTFSLLILYEGFYKNYNRCKYKHFVFLNNGEFLYDHLEKFRIKNKCSKLPIF